MKNEYGLDVDYFKRYFELMVRDVKMYTPDEMARSLARMSVVADEKVLLEKEFDNKRDDRKELYTCLRDFDNYSTFDTLYRGSIFEKRVCKILDKVGEEL